MATLVADPKVQENPRDLQTFACGGAGGRSMDGFSLPSRPREVSEQESSLDLFNWELFGISPGSCASPGVISASFLGPVSYQISVTVASGRPTVCLCTLWPGAPPDESHVPHTGRPREFPPEDCPAEKHSGQYCISSPQRQAALSLPLGLILLSL